MPDSPWYVYQIAPTRLPLTLPTTASYVTALVRSKVWPWIREGNAIHTHTDSVHIPDGFDCPETGINPGDWGIKSQGWARAGQTIHDKTVRYI